VNDQPPTNWPFGDRDEPEKPETNEPDDVEHTLNLDQPGSPPEQPPAASQPWSFGQPPAGQPTGQPIGQPMGQPPTGPPYGRPPQPYPYGGYPLTPAPKTAKSRVSSGSLVLVCSLALLIGLLGGALGSIAIDQWDDAHQEAGQVNGGLGDVDTVSKPPLPADNGSIAKVAQTLLPSTLQILADFEGEELGATGSGFVLDEQGHIVTNNHVVQSADESDGKVQVVDQTGKRYDADVVGRSPVYDLAILYVPDLPDPQPAALGSSVNLQIGEGVVAIGSPLGLSSTVTSGIVSALNRPVSTRGDTEDSASYINAVQTDAAINPGNSGGPLVDLQGRVVGVNSAIATTGGAVDGESGNIGVGFAIPIEQVKITADQILRDGEARYPVIGATVNSDGTGDGAHIQDVEKGSPADKAGLKKGDVVTALDDRLVSDSPTLIVAIRTHVPGDQVKLTVERDGEKKEITVTLGSKVG
jgi:putative serine protease PepD